MTPLLFAIIAAIGNVVGAWAVTHRDRRSLHAIDSGIAFGAGFMIAVALLGVIPEALALNPDAAVYMLLGFVGVHFAQHVITPHFHFGEEVHRISPGAGVSALIGLSLHTCFDGVAIASGFAASHQLGLLLFFAVLFHKLPEGVAMASVMVAGGQGNRRAMGAAVALGVATILGVLLTETFKPLATHGLAISAGVTLYVAGSNLIPEFQGKRGWPPTVAFFGGVAAFFVSHRLLERFGL